MKILFRLSIGIGLIGNVHTYYGMLVSKKDENRVEETSTVQLCPKKAQKSYNPLAIANATVAVYNLYQAGNALRKKNIPLFLEHSIWVTSHMLTAYSLQSSEEHIENEDLTLWYGLASMRAFCLLSPGATLSECMSVLGVAAVRLANGLYFMPAIDNEKDNEDDEEEG